MECPFCYTNFEYRLSICPHCGKATDDPIYQELFSRVKPRKVEDQLPTGKAAEAFTATPVMEEPVAEATELPREKPAVTAEIRSKNTCNTLLDFPGVKPELPEWRQELQSRLKEIKDQRGQALPANNEALVAKKHAVGGTGLVMALLEEPQAQAHPPLIEKALRRIEESRQRYEPQSAAYGNNAASYAPVPTAPTRPASLYRSETAFAPAPLTAVKPVEEEFDDGSPRPFVFSENETVEDRLSRIGLNHQEKLARAAELKDDLLSRQKFDTNRLRKFTPVISYEDGEGKATATVKFRTETVTPKTMRPREQQEEPATEVEEAPKSPVIRFEEREGEEVAPFAFRFNAGLFDFIISGFLSLIILSPFMFLGGNFFNIEGAFAFLVTCSIVMFLYITAAVGLIGRTLGMGLFSLEMIDAEDNDYPTFNQAAVSSCVYLLSLALGGIGFATIFWNAERRAAHDLLSGTMVVREN